MAGITSTVPAAVNTLGLYMQNVAAANPALNPAVYMVGLPVGSVRNNFLMVGSMTTGELISPESYKWNAVPGTAKLRGESYALLGTIRVWSGASGKDAALARLGDAFTLLNGLQQQIVNDLGANAYTTAALSPSGSWGDLDVSMDGNGPLDGKGWGVALGFELHVLNVQLQG